MIVTRAHKVRPVERLAKVAAMLDAVNESQLREWVRHISVPRHFAAEPKQNRATADWLAGVFDAWGFRVERQGQFSNIVALPEGDLKQVVVVGAHYDSVPECPGADDNGSAVAAMLGCAAACSRWHPALPVVFVAFNREEDGLLGSRDFIRSYLPQAAFEVRCAHILEMVGYATSEPGSQRLPAGLPVKVSDTGDFLGLLANGVSSAALDLVLRHAGTYVPGLPVTGLSVKFGAEKYFPVLARSDHAPFWDAKIPAVMWTDSSEFRNHNYHLSSDTPDSLNYGFLKQVSQLLTACVIHQATVS